MAVMASMWLLTERLLGTPCNSHIDPIIAMYIGCHSHVLLYFAKTALHSMLQDGFKKRCYMAVMHLSGGCFTKMLSALIVVLKVKI